MPTTKTKKYQNINDSLLTKELYELSQTYLDLFLYENAVFYAEKLYCECQSEDVCYLLAKGYIGMGKFHQAFQILKDTKGHQCRYLFVIICIKLNKFIEAEKGILTQKLFGKGINNKELDEVMPQGAYGYYLYGNILEKLNRKNDAFQAYKNSLDIDPFMWCSFNKLCKIDPKNIDNNKYFSELNPKMLIFNKKMNNILLNPENNTDNNTKSYKLKNIILNNNVPLSNNLFNMTSVDNSTNSLNSRENPINSVANFRISTTSLNNTNNNNINTNNNISNEQMNKYRSILDFGQMNNNINSKLISVHNTENKTSTPDNNNKTPSIHKKNDEIDYEKNYLPQKKVNNPFVFSSTPNQVQLDFNNLSSSANNKLGSNIGSNSINNGNKNVNSNINSNNNGDNSNKIKDKDNANNLAQDTSFSYFNINFSNNNNKSSSNININEGANLNNNINSNNNDKNNSNSNNRINPFNINNSGIFNGSNINISGAGNNSLFNNGGNNTNFNNNNNNLNNSFGLSFKLTPTNKVNSLFVQNNNNNGSYNNNNNNHNLQIPKNNYLLNNIEISPDNKINRIQQDNSNNNLNNALFNFSSETNKHINSTSFQKNINENSNTIDKDKNNNSLEFKNITQLLNIFSEIIKKISNYDCASALDLLLNKIPPSQFKSCFVYTLIGRCYFELAKYKEAEKYYNLSLSLDPSYLTGLEYFSSVLWHLKDQFKCCNLAHLCLEQCQFAPETWVVLGNTFSLQKEHETAIKFFNRATQINPAFAYSYTLAGHEYVDNENFTEANNCFKKALAYDERQVNAWWGLGNIQLKEQNYSEAIKLFRRCIGINSHSAVLYFYLGTAYLQNKDIKNALNNLINAQKLDSKNPMIQYQVANIYMNQGKNEEALKILKNLEENMPKEAPIYISIGKIYKNKKEYKKALDYFNKAIDLDPKDSNLAKTLIERLQIDNGSV